MEEKEIIERYNAYITELSKVAEELSNHCVKCTKPKIITKDVLIECCDYCEYKRAMNEHMENYKKELLKEQ